MDQSACERYGWVKKNSDENPDTKSIWVGDEEFWPLSGKPYFHVSIKKTLLNPYYKMVFPKKMSDLLPSTITPAIINCRDRDWQATYNAEQKRLYGWKNIADTYLLKVGDVLVFELTENSTRTLKFRLQILRGELPPELLEKEAEGRTGEGQTAEAAIVID